MNAKEFQLLARVINERVENAKHLTDFDMNTKRDELRAIATLRDFAVVLAYELAREYPRTFNPKMFFDAIGNKHAGVCIPKGTYTQDEQGLCSECGTDLCEHTPECTCYTCELGN